MPAATPDAGTVLEKLGLVFISLGRIKSAIESFGEALVYKPKSVATMMRLGELQIISSQPLGAMQAYRAAMQVAPRDPSP